VTVFRFVEREKANHHVATMCRVLGVSASGYWAWRSRPVSKHVLSDRALGDRIAEIHRRSRGTYGAPRVRAELHGQGIACARKRVARLMTERGLVGVHRRRRIVTTRRDPARPSAPDLVERRFTASGPDRLWVADITYLPTQAGFLYLAAIVDAFSRFVVGWSMAPHLRTELVSSALEMALGRRRPSRGLVHHSDHGTQYASVEFGHRLRDAGIAASMGSVGDAYDNALAETFFATLETELIARSQWPTHAAARAAVFDYIETFYNRIRRHSALGYLSPADYERSYRSKTSAA
jgi:putative transposase